MQLKQPSVYSPNKNRGGFTNQYNGVTLQAESNALISKKEKYSYPIKPIPEVITEQQILDIGRHFLTAEQRSFYYLLYITSARISELKNIQPRDVRYSMRKGKEIVHIHLPNKKNKKIIVKDLAFPIDSTEIQEMS